MKIGLYAGSFDPWSVGHQYVLENTLTIFDKIHVIIALHPSKQSLLAPDVRARLVAHAIDPTKDWWKSKLPLVVNKNVTIDVHEGLVADYAKKHRIKHLIRGLRSTTDFEAEFNLYFANQAIESTLQTWAIMCPPRLLHCSSTFIRAVVGKPDIKFVGTSFVAQTCMLGLPHTLGQEYDLNLASKTAKMTPYEREQFTENLQIQFTKFIQKQLKTRA